MIFDSRTTKLHTKKDRVAALALAALVFAAFLPVRAADAENYKFASTVLAGSTIVLPTFGNSFMKNEFPVAENREPVRSKQVVATAYSSDPWQTDSTPCFPAMNYDLCEAAEQGEVNTIAANFLPKGTQVRFPELFGDKIFVVRDRMNARYNGTSHIDFYTAVLGEDGKLDNAASKKAAQMFGLKRLTMEVYGK